MFEPSGNEGTPIARLLIEMNRYLDSLGATIRLDARSPAPGTPPDVQFSCETDLDGECTTGEGALGRGDIVMRLAVARPSTRWVTWARDLMDEAGRPDLVVITLEVGQYRIHQRGLRGDKVVELGTDYSVTLPWLTSLETPVSVLQLTGARVDRDGRARRIGAEGLLARRTSLPLSALGAQALITDEEVEHVRSARREELPGTPLVWQVAVRNLLAGLTDRPALGSP